MTTPALPTAPVPGAAAVVVVDVATLWSEPSAPRPGIDDAALTRPTDLDAWNAAMPGDEERGWLLPHLETQALFGTPVLVDELREGWARVVVPSQRTSRDERGYPGWVPAVQLVTDPGFVRLVESAPSLHVTADRACLRDVEGAPGPVPALVPLNTVLPVVGREPEAVRVALPGGGTALLAETDAVVRESGEQAPIGTADDVIATGERFLGLRYLWAGMSPWGFDCSGFAWAILLRHGVTIPRDAGDQLRLSGLPRIDREDLRRGDLVFFSGSSGGDSIRHVAVYVGEGRILHSPNFSRDVTEESLADYDARDEYAGAVRPIP